MDFGEIKKVLWKVLIFNWLVAFAKIFIGLFAGTLSILADGLHSLFDGFTNIVGVFGMKLAAKPPDKGHPYGHRKYEAIASQAILLFLIITVVEVCERIIDRFSHPLQPEISWLMIGVLFVCVLIDFFVARYESKKGKELKSVILKADSSHTRSHYITTGAVILGAILIKLGAPVIVDPIISIFVVGFVARLAYEIFIETSAILSDKAILGTKNIRDIIKEIKGVESCHQIRTRGDEKYVILDLHLVLDANLSLADAHGIGEKVKERVQQVFPEVKDITIHQEPEDCGNDCVSE